MQILCCAVKVQMTSQTCWDQGLSRIELFSLTLADKPVEANRPEVLAGLIRVGLAVPIQGIHSPFKLVWIHNNSKAHETGLCPFIFRNWNAVAWVTDECRLIHQNGSVLNPHILAAMVTGWMLKSDKKEAQGNYSQCTKLCHGDSSSNSTQSNPCLSL